MSECPGLTLSGESLRDGVDPPPTLADMGIAGAPLYTPRSDAMEREWRVGISACPLGERWVSQWGVPCSSATRLLVPWGSHYDAFCKVLTPRGPQVQQLY